jgi:hypothetical protein
MARKKVIQPIEGAAQEGSAKTENKPEPESVNVIDAKFEVVKSPSLAELESAVEVAKRNVMDSNWEWAKAITAIHDSKLYPHEGEPDGFYLYMWERWEIRKAMAALYIAWVKDETRQQFDARMQLLLGEGKINTLETQPPDKPVVPTATKSRAVRKKRQEKSADPLDVKKRVMKRIKTAQKLADDKKNPNLWYDDLGEIIDERTVEQLAWYMKNLLSKEGYQGNDVVKWVIPQKVPGTPWTVVQMEVLKAQDAGYTVYDTEEWARNALRALVSQEEINATGTEDRPTGVPDQGDMMNQDSEGTEYPSLESIERSFKGWLPEKWEARYPTNVLGVVINWASEQDLEGTKDVLGEAWEEVNAEWERVKESTKKL